MDSPPEIVGGASVVRWVVIDSRPTSDSQDAVGGVEASRLAICRHDGEAAFYLFRCDDLWQVGADTWHETLEAAMRQAESEYIGVIGAWRAV
jgi:hypothetical protein